MINFCPWFESSVTLVKSKFVASCLLVFFRGCYSPLNLQIAFYHSASSKNINCYMYWEKDINM